ncbi:helix-turn-helix domain-containing protein [Glycomyces sp. NPDC046736]|uniref:NACHT domain-containing protein n=1 Tax=Glycomyces sp. NPDC046736 TaxID=3155615 RepID=UPI003402AAD6
MYREPTIVAVPPRKPRLVLKPEFARLFKQHRERSGLSQEALAKHAGVAEKTVRRYENGMVARPREATLLLFKVAFGLTDEEYEEFHTAAHRSRTEEPSIIRRRLHRAADKLAFEVRAKLEQEEERQDLRNPSAIPVGWRTVDTDAVDHWENIAEAEAGATVPPLDLDGSLADLESVYGRIPSGRLVVLGRAGSGKSVVATRLALNLLDTWEAPSPVPVVFRLESWNPRVDLQEWLATQLENEHPHLLRLMPNRSTTAAALLTAGLVLPILDGFDEMAEGLHPKAFRQLNQRSGPLALTSRPGEFVSAVEETGLPLSRSAVVELVDLGPDQVAGYLSRAARPASRWQPVLDAVRSEPEGHLARAFATPLMVSLAKEVYGSRRGRDPVELLDTRAFSTAESVERHLLGRLVPTAYRDQTEDARFEPVRAGHWLGYLAHHLESRGEHDLAWWKIGTSLGIWERMAVMTAVLGLLLAFLDSIAMMVVGRTILPVGIAVDFAVAASFAIAHGVLARSRSEGFGPSRVQMRLRGNPTLSWGDVGRRFSLGFLAGLLLPVGFTVVREVVLGTEYGLSAAQIAVNTVVDTLGFGIPGGLCGGIGLVVIALLERPLDLKSVPTPTDLMRASRRTLLTQALIFAPVLAVAFPFALWSQIQLLRLLPPSFGQWHWAPAEAAILGGYAGTFATIGYVIAFSGWGQWLVFGRLWLPLTGRLPWPLPVFLDDACARGVLRRSGAVYQFRHAQLQEHLALAYKENARRRSRR